MMFEFEYHALAPSGEPTTGTVISKSTEEARTDLQRRGLHVEFIGQGTTPEFIGAIDKCLRERDSIIGCMKECNEQSAWLKRDTNWNLLFSRLQKGASASELVTDGRLAMFLPFVMMFAPPRENGSEQKENRDFATWVRFYLQQANRRRLLWRVFSYPVVMVAIYVAILIAMSYGIVPQFRRVYEDFEINLPAPTLRLLWISDQITEHPLRAMLMFVAVAAGIYFLYRGLCWCLDQIQDVPILGKITRSSKKQLLAVSRLTSTLAELIRINAPLPTAIQIAGLASGNRAMISETEATARMLTTHLGRQDIRFVSNYLPATLVHALQAAPEGKPSSELIQSLANVYAERLEQRINIARGIAAPATTMLMAWLVWNIVSALMSPLVSLISSLSGG